MARIRMIQVAVSLASIGIVALVPQIGTASHVRTGTIVGGIGFMFPLDCAEAPDCAAWLAADCDGALTGVDTAAESSIVNVDALGNGSTQRRFEVEPVEPVGTVAGGVVVQMWRANCSQVTAARRLVTSAATFSVPTSARWMTVVGSDNEMIRWWLT